MSEEEDDHVKEVISDEIGAIMQTLAVKHEGGKMINIPLQRQHTCSDRCAMHYFYTGIGAIPMGKNESYNEETGKCEKSGEIVDGYPSISSYLDDKEDFNMANRNEVVIPQPKAMVFFRYPLKELVTFEVLGTEEGITREVLVDFVCNTYQRIYDEEAAGATTPVLSAEERMKAMEARGKPMLMNRQTSDGPYGIYGHDLDDLYLEGISYHPETGRVELSIGS